MAYFTKVWITTTYVLFCTQRKTSRKVCSENLAVFVSHSRLCWRITQTLCLYFRLLISPFKCFFCYCTIFFSLYPYFIPGSRTLSPCKCKMRPPRLSVIKILLSSMITYSINRNILKILPWFLSVDSGSCCFQSFWILLLLIFLYALTLPVSSITSINAYACHALIK